MNGAPSEIAIGESLTLCLHGPPFEMGLFMVSSGQGPIKSKYGDICLDFPTFFDLHFTFDANGDYCIDVEVECDPSLIGITVYSQFITCKPLIGNSNQVATTIVDGVCGGDLCTFTQGGWGTSCSGGNPGCRRDQWFDTVFPNGVTLGDSDGIDGDSIYALLFTS